MIEEGVSLQLINASHVIQSYLQQRNRKSDPGVDRIRRPPHRDAGGDHHHCRHLSCALARYLFRYATRRTEDDLYHQLKVSLGKALLLGLEVLVAADIVRTVALEATLESVIVLGLLVLIRTFLSWSLVVEIEGHWPWRQANVKIIELEWSPSGGACSNDKESHMEQSKAAVQKLKPTRENLIADVLAGLTFAVVNVPQAMAHALLAMVNPVFGIFTLMVALPIGAIFTGSVYMNVSTTSALSVAAGSGLAYTPPSQRVEALAVLVLLVGVIQLLAGLFRLGFLIRFVSNAVMTGFLNGVAVLIILGQLGDLTGFQSTFSNNVLRALDLVFRFETINVPTTIIGLLTLAGIVGLLFTPLRKFAFIIAIVAATVLLALLTLTALPTSMYFEQRADRG